MRFKSGEVVIELAGKQCQQFMFPLMAMVLRGRFDVRLIRRESSNTQIGNLPVIPGQYVCLDQKGRTLRVLDPLALPEYRRTLDEANDILEPWFGRMRPHDTSVLSGIEPWEAKTALWWMAQKVWDKKAELLSGDIPANDAAGRTKILVELPGELKVRWFAPLTLADGTQQSPFATKEEIDRLVLRSSADRLTLEPAMA